jgi:hypothetical protein
MVPDFQAKQFNTELISELNDQHILLNALNVSHFIIVCKRSFHLTFVCQTSKHSKRQQPQATIWPDRLSLDGSDRVSLTYYNKLGWMRIRSGWTINILIFFKSQIDFDWIPNHSILHGIELTRCNLKKIESDLN